MADCRNDDCGIKAHAEGYYCPKCWEQEQQEVSIPMVFFGAVKKAKPKHVVLIIYPFSTWAIISSYGFSIEKVNSISPWYGGSLTFALVAGLIIAGLLIGLQLLNERKRIS